MTAGGRKAAKGFFLLFSDIIGHHFIAESGMGLFRFLQISPRLLKPLVERPLQFARLYVCLNGFLRLPLVFIRGVRIEDIVFLDLQAVKPRLNPSVYLVKLFSQRRDFFGIRLVKRIRR